MLAVPQLKKTQSAPQSLLSGTAVGERHRIRVFFQSESKMLKTEIDAQNLTANCVVAAALEVFSRTVGLDFSSRSEDFELFAARKDGTRDDGLPALDGTQPVQRTFIKRFCILPIAKVQSLGGSVETKDSASFIKTEIHVKGYGKGETSETSPEPPQKFSFCRLFCVKE